MSALDEFDFEAHSDGEENLFWLLSGFANAAAAVPALPSSKVLKLDRGWLRIMGLPPSVIEATCTALGIDREEVDTVAVFLASPAAAELRRGADAEGRYRHGRRHSPRLRTLAVEAVRNGAPRKCVAAAAGCSRQQLWRWECNSGLT